MMPAAVNGTGYWYAIAKQGETHDRAAEWVDAKTTKAHYAWSREGKAMEETIGFRLTTARTIEFRGVVGANGAEVGSFSGRLER